MTPVVTPTGRSGFGFTEFTVEVTGLNVHLDGAGANYHLNVTPIGSIWTVVVPSIQQPVERTASAVLAAITTMPSSTARYCSVRISSQWLTSDEFSDFSMGVKGEVGGGGGNDITLTASAHRHMGQRSVELVWTPADGGMVNIILDGVVIATTEDDGNYRDPRGSSEGMDERLTYQVCETDSGDCSNTFRIKVKGKAGH